VKTCAPNEPPSTTELKKPTTTRPGPPAKSGGYLTRISIVFKNWLGRLRVEITHTRIF
jgi:hypothetical protein